MELIKTNVTFTKPEIKYDVKDIDNQIKVLEEKYQTLIISEEEIPEIKKEIAQFNKIKKAISTKRIDTIKEITEPTKQFETDLKGFEKRLGDLYNVISEQVKTFENEQKQARKEEIMQWEEYKPYMLFDERWLNKSTSDNSIKSDLSHLTTIHNNNVKMIETTCELSGLEKEKYIELLDNQKDINEIIALIQNDKEVKDSYVKEEPKEIVDKVVQSNAPKTKETYYITASKEQFELLEKFMLDNEIEYQIKENDIWGL